MPRPVAWGARWLDAMVAADLVDAAHLGRARGMVARGEVSDVVIEPVTVRAAVVGRSALERRVRLGVRRLPPEQWAEVAATIESSGRWVAAVLAGDLPEALHESLVPRRLGLFANPTDVSLDCSCSDSLDRCVHSAALCCHLAGALDVDPLLFVTLRGGDRARLLPASAAPPVQASVGRRNSAIPGRPGDPTMAATQAWRRRLGELPGTDRHRRVVGRPRVGASPPSAELGFDQAGLDRLVRDAAHRADAVLAGTAGSWLALDEATDAVRRLAGGGLGADEAASTVGCSVETAATLAEAWRSSGPVGVDVLLTPRRLTETELAEVAAAVASWSDGPVRSRSTGALLADGRQVRRSGDGTWVVLRPDPLVGWVIDDWAPELGDLALG